MKYRDAKIDMLKVRFNVILLIGLFIISFSREISSQDFHFSQFLASPVYINPANTGNFQGDYRLSGNYRDQWSSIAIPYKTVAISMDRNFFLFHKKIGGGISLIGDQSGDIGLTTSKLFFSGTYYHTIDGYNLHFGIQPGLLLRTYGSNEITYPDQYDHSIGYFNPSIPTQELINSGKRLLFDLNTGIVASKVFGKYFTEAGISLFNINSPKETFNRKVMKDRMPVKQIYFARMETKLDEHWKIYPEILYAREKKGIDFLTGTRLSYKLDENNLHIKNLLFGAYFRNMIFRNADAIILLAGLEVQKFKFAVNYDFNVFSLSRATSFTGAFEISIIYTEISTIFNKFTIPCDRY